MITQIYFHKADFYAALGESKASIICKVICRPETQTEFKEDLTFTIEFSDTSLTFDELERQSIEKAKDFIKSFAASLE